MQALNAFFIILLIPLFEGVVYPLLKRPKPLKRMCAGMFLASVAFVFAGFLQMKIQVNYLIYCAVFSADCGTQWLKIGVCHLHNVVSLDKKLLPFVFYSVKSINE